MPGDRSPRKRLISLARNIQDSRDRGSTDADSLNEFERLLPGTDIDNLCNSDLDVATIVDICLGERDIKHLLSREELLTLVKRFMDPDGFATEAEGITAYKVFDANCKHHAGGDLIFYPEEHFDGRSNPTPEEIVDKALRHEG